MELDSFIDNFAAQFDDTDRSEFTADTKFRELEEWSSLVMLSVIAMIDEEYDITIRGALLQKNDTIGQLFEAVKALK